MTAIKIVFPPDFAVSGRDAVEILEHASIRTGEVVAVNARYLAIHTETFTEAFAKCAKNLGVSMVILLPNGSDPWHESMHKSLSTHNVPFVKMTVDDFEKSQQRSDSYSI